MSEPVMGLSDVGPPPVVEAWAAVAELVTTGALPEPRPGLPSDAEDVGPAPELTAYLAVEQVLSLLASVQLDLMERMRDVHRAHAETLSAGSRVRSTPAQIEACARDGVASEIEVATGVGAMRCRELVEYACAGARATATRTALAEGRVSLHRAMTVQEMVADLPDDEADEICRAVIDRRRPDGCPPPLRQLRAWVRRERLRHGCDDRERRRRALEARSVYSATEADGTGQLWVNGSAARVAAASQRVDRLAREARRRGDARTLPQLRSDVALDLLMHGGVASGSTGELPGRADLAPAVDWDRLGELPPAHVSITVGLGTLMAAVQGVGRDEGRGGGRDESSPREALAGAPPGCVAELVGHGPIPDDELADLAVSAGSVWSRIVTDPVDGVALEATPPRYTPPAAMARLVRARDQGCRFPGCAHEARHADLDHVVPWRPRPADEGSLTRVSNLQVLHRRHHNLKTKGIWQARPARRRAGPDAAGKVGEEGEVGEVGEVAGVGEAVEWVSPLGQRVVVAPPDLRGQASSG